ncbi:collagen alpha-1(III) chain-like [Eptesicus fuscus]|uniref:collagen alpha-1(III) chain-like n=1 Tax=Eptesicus fuscus TaxID=29078 RepID=UPI002403F6BA|nr:collagen alpha-1(III) chain-like [Eptesicus fuscus]
MPLVDKHSALLRRGRVGAREAAGRGTRTACARGLTSGREGRGGFQRRPGGPAPGGPPLVAARTRPSRFPSPVSSLAPPRPPQGVPMSGSVGLHRSLPPPHHEGPSDAGPRRHAVLGSPAVLSDRRQAALRVHPSLLLGFRNPPGRASGREASRAPPTPARGSQGQGHSPGADHLAPQDFIGLQKGD